MSEKVHIKLRCPVCGRSGTAEVRETNDHAWAAGHRQVSVYIMPEGFKSVDRQGSWFDGAFDIDCAEHCVSAILKRA